MTVPYFYIIEHIPTGKRYAGSRWALGCNPAELMKDKGYTTSSNTVNAIIASDGIHSFKVIEIQPMDNPYVYETKFLEKHECSSSEDWFNKHNNLGRPAPYGTKEFKTIMIEKYGVSHNSQIPEVRKKMTINQKKFYQENPEVLITRAIKIAANRIKNGTTGAGIKRPTYTNNGLTGNWERTLEYRYKFSQRQKISSAFVKNNPMNNPEKRKLVGLSKVGRKKYINPETLDIKMCLPGTEPIGFIATYIIRVNNVNH